MNKSEHLSQSNITPNKPDPLPILYAIPLPQTQSNQIPNVLFLYPLDQLPIAQTGSICFAWYQSLPDDKNPIQTNQTPSSILPYLSACLRTGFYFMVYPNTSHNVNPNQGNIKMGTRQVHRYDLSHFILRSLPASITGVFGSQTQSTTSATGFQSTRNLFGALDSLVDKPSTFSTDQISPHLIRTPTGNVGQNRPSGFQPLGSRQGGGGGFDFHSDMKYQDDHYNPHHNNISSALHHTSLFQPKALFPHDGTTTVQLGITATGLPTQLTHPSTFHYPPPQSNALTLSMFSPHLPNTASNKMFPPTRILPLQPPNTASNTASNGSTSGSTAQSGPILIPPSNMTSPCPPPFQSKTGTEAAARQGHQQQQQQQQNQPQNQPQTQVVLPSTLSNPLPLSFPPLIPTSLSANNPANMVQMAEPKLSEMAQNALFFGSVLKTLTVEDMNLLMLVLAHLHSPCRDWVLTTAKAHLNSGAKLDTNTVPSRGPTPELLSKQGKPTQIPTKLIEGFHKGSNLSEFVAILNKFTFSDWQAILDPIISPSSPVLTIDSLPIGSSPILITTPKLQDLIQLNSTVAKHSLPAFSLDNPLALPSQPQSQTSRTTTSLSSFVKPHLSDTVSKLFVEKYQTSPSKIVPTTQQLPTTNTPPLKPRETTPLPLTLGQTELLSDLGFTNFLPHLQTSSGRLIGNQSPLSPLLPSQLFSLLSPQHPPQFLSNVPHILGSVRAILNLPNYVPAVPLNPSQTGPLPRSIVSSLLAPQTIESNLSTTGFVDEKGFLTSGGASSMSNQSNTSINNISMNMNNNQSSLLASSLFSPTHNTTINNTSNLNNTSAGSQTNLQQFQQPGFISPIHHSSASNTPHFTHSQPPGNFPSQSTPQHGPLSSTWSSNFPQKRQYSMIAPNQSTPTHNPQSHHTQQNHLNLATMLGLEKNNNLISPHNQDYAFQSLPIEQQNLYHQQFQQSQQPQQPQQSQQPQQPQQPTHQGQYSTQFQPQPYLQQLPYPQHPQHPQQQQLQQQQQQLQLLHQQHQQHQQLQAHQQQQQQQLQAQHQQQQHQQHQQQHQQHQHQQLQQPNQAKTEQLYQREESYSETEQPSKRLKTAPRPKPKPARKQPRTVEGPMEDSFDDEEEEDGDSEWAKKRSGKPRTTRHSTRAAHTNGDILVVTSPTYSGNKDITPAVVPIPSTKASIANSTVAQSAALPRSLHRSRGGELTFQKPLWSLTEYSTTGKDLKPTSVPTYVRLSTLQPPLFVFSMGGIIYGFHICTPPGGLPVTSTTATLNQLSQSISLRQQQQQHRKQEDGDDSDDDSDYAHRQPLIPPSAMTSSALTTNQGSDQLVNPLASTLASATVEKNEVINYTSFTRVDRRTKQGRQIDQTLLLAIEHNSKLMKQEESTKRLGSSSSNTTVKPWPVTLNNTKVIKLDAEKTFNSYLQKQYEELLQLIQSEQEEVASCGHQPFYSMGAPDVVYEATPAPAPAPQEKKAQYKPLLNEQQQTPSTTAATTAATTPTHPHHTSISTIHEHKIPPSTTDNGVIDEAFTHFGELSSTGSGIHSLYVNTTQPIDSDDKDDVQLSQQQIKNGVRNLSATGEVDEKSLR